MDPITGVGLGVLLVILGVPLILKRVPPNAFYGLRVPATFKSETIWYEANRLAGWDMVIVGAGIAAFAAWLSLAPGGLGIDDRRTLTGVILFAVIVMAVKGWIVANRLARTSGESK